MKGYATCVPVYIFKLMRKKDLINSTVSMMTTDNFGFFVLNATCSGEVSS